MPEPQELRHDPEAMTLVGHLEDEDEDAEESDAVNTGRPVETPILEALAIFSELNSSSSAPFVKLQRPASKKTLKALGEPAAVA